MFRADLEHQGDSPFRAARRAGLGGGTVLRWIHGQTEPRAAELYRVIEACHLNPERYKSYLDSAAGAKVLQVCPECGRPRSLMRSRLRFVVLQATGRTALPRRANGVYERLCRPCSLRRRQPRATRAAQDALLQRRFGPNVEYTAEDPLQRQVARREAAATLNRVRGSRTENRARLLAAAKRSKGERHRLAIAISNVAARVSRVAPLHLCPLCELVVHKQQWHRICWETWVRWLGRRNMGNTRPVPQAQRGPKPERNLGRNYALLIGRRARNQSLRELAVGSSKSSVTEAVKGFLRRLPASWNLVFSSSPKTRRANHARQALVSLPDELMPLIESGQRDLLIRRLLGFRMPEIQITTLTGASVYRVQGIAQQTE
jgi:hypothetical protein